MNLLTGRNTPDFAKYTVYRFMKMLPINWIRVMTILASRIIKEAIVSLNSEERANVLIMDDSMFERNRSNKVELLAKVYDHAKHAYKKAKNAAIPAKDVLFDSCFSSPSSLRAGKEIGYDVIAMGKKTPKMFFRYDGEDMSLISIYNKNKKRRGCSKYLLSVIVDVLKDGEIIRIYGKRWDIEVFFKVCKSDLHFSKECRVISFDTMADITWI